jgi:putative hydrolase of the HAD superfamily
MPSSQKLQAVIFDYGAVLCHLPTEAQLDHFSAVAGLPREEFWKLYLATRAPYDRGTLDARGYWNYFGQRAGRAYSEEQHTELAHLDIAVWRSLNPSMLRLANEVRKARLKTALLSNMPRELMHAIRAEDDWLHLFDKHFFSCEIGAVKPEPAIFRFVVDALGVTPDQALLIDDNTDNIAAAKQFGVRALWFENFKALVPQLAAELDGAGAAIRSLV